MRLVGIAPVEILHQLIQLQPSGQGNDDLSDKDHKSGSAQDPENLKRIRKHTQRLIAHPLFEKYRLTHQDVRVIAALWQHHLEQPGRGSDWLFISASAGIKSHKVMDCLDYLYDLLERGIVCFDERISGDYHLNPVILQAAEFTLGKDIILRIMGKDLFQELKQSLKDVWLTNDDFLCDLRLIFDKCYKSFGEIGSRSMVLEHQILSTCLSILMDRINSTQHPLGIKDLMNEHKLDNSELAILLVVLYHRLSGYESISEPDLLFSLASDNRQSAHYLELFSESSTLVSKGIISKDYRFNRDKAIGWTIPRKTLQVLNPNIDTNPESKPDAKLSPFFLKQQPSQTLADLIIPESDKLVLAQIINKCHSGQKRDLETWGFKPDNHKQGVVLLLYGAPGTGKTFTAGVIANELKRDLLILNVPELRDKYYGETEKLVKRAFCEMRELAADIDNAPVFLLNEADQLIHNRIANTSTCSTIENTIQSIILEELETFPGILILTTNLESNLDEAFFRRFDLKFRFRLPDLESRRKLWKMYLRKEIPGSADIDVEPLAQKYQFSGAQIALVVQNACVAAIGRTGKSKRLSQHDLLQYADLEQPWANQVNKSIGF